MSGADKGREASRKSEEGLLVSLYPDYCRSPHAVIPYIIVAYQHEEANTSATVRMTGERSHTTGSLILRSHGDEAGLGGGVQSGTMGSVCQPKTHSGTARIEGEYAVRHNDEWWMNNKNTIGKLYWLIEEEASPSTQQPSRDELAEEDVDSEAGVGEGGIGAQGQASGVLLAGATAVTAGGGMVEPWSGGRAVSLPGTSGAANRWWAKAWPNLRKGVGAVAPSILGKFLGWSDFLIPQELGDGTLTGALRREAATIEAAAHALQADGATAAELELFHNMAWEELGQRRPELVQPHIWVAVFPQGEIEDDTPPLTGITADNARVSARARRRDNPCKYLACLPPLPGSKYRGGAHYCMKMPTGDGLDSHHMPAQGYGNRFPAELGPAIQIEPEDHWMTASHPASWSLGKDYSKQALLLQMEQNSAAFKLDVIDMLDVEIRAGQPGKYEAAVLQATAYMECLKKNGMVQ